MVGCVKDSLFISLFLHGFIIWLPEIPHHYTYNLLYPPYVGIDSIVFTGNLATARHYEQITHLPYLRFGPPLKTYFLCCPLF